MVTQIAVDTFRIRIKNKYFTVEVKQRSHYSLGQVYFLARISGGYNFTTIYRNYGICGWYDIENVHRGFDDTPGYYHWNRSPLY